MSNETRELRAVVPAAVADRIEQAAEILGVSLRQLCGAAVQTGLEETVCELARHRAAELAAFLPPETVKTTTVDEAERQRKPGRAERQAAARAEELKEQRRRQRSPSKTPRDPVN